MIRPLHGRRARRAQWLSDAAALDEVQCRAVFDSFLYVDRAARILRARSAAKRARRLAARRAARRHHDADALALHAEDMRRLAARRAA